MAEFLLEMQNISKSFFGVQVLHDVSLNVKQGEVHVLLGENGAGKSTLIKILAGAYKREKGEIFISGKPANIHDPKEAIDMGISVIYQEFNLNPYMSVYENIYLGKEYVNCGLINKKKAIDETNRVLNMVGLDIDPRTLIQDLSVAQKQMVEIAKALSMDVKVLVLDEPTAAITDTETEKLFAIVRDLKAKGIGVIYISHRMKELFEIGDRCTILRDGQYVDTVALKDVKVADLTRMMVGRDVDFTYRKNPYCNSGETVMTVENINYKNLLKDISFNLKKGEIMGVTGLVGAGRTELAKCIMGAYKRKSGNVKIGNVSIEGKSPKEAIDKGVVYLSEDRKDEGLILKHDIKENICLPNLKKFGKLFLNKQQQINTANEYSEKLRVKSTSCFQEVKNLSGGNQQKVVVGKWLCSNAKVYIFDEPTRGIDVGARDEIYNIMHELVKNGASILMISSDLVEVLRISDRIMVMSEGQVVAMLSNEETLTQQQILSYSIQGGVS